VTTPQQGNVLQRLVYRLHHLRPWQQSLATALLLVLSFPPFPFPFLAFFAWVPLLRLLERGVVGPSPAYLARKPRRLSRWLGGRWRRWAYAYRHIYVTIMLWNFGCCYWLLATALGVGSTGEAIQAAVAGLAANLVNPMVQALPLLLYVWVRRRASRPLSLVAFVLLYLAMEYLHLRWDLTWSWTTLGHAFASWPWYIQFIEFTGVAGMSALILVANALVFEVYSRQREAGITPQEADPKTVGLFAQRNRRLFSALLIVITLPAVLSPLLMLSSRSVFTPDGTLKVRIVQPNIDPYAKFNILTPDQQVELMAQWAESAPLDGIDLVILPETALPGAIEEGYQTQVPTVRPLLALTQKYRLNILTGLNSYVFYRPGHTPLPPSAEAVGTDGTTVDVFNAAVVLGSPDQRVYRKGKLVPFTERTPFIGWFNALRDYSIDIGGGFGSYGLPDSVFTLRTSNGTQLIPLICYESMFGSYAAQLVRQGGQLVCVITNDGWFGQTSGYLQHAAWAVLRAIEFRRDVARSANTGRSLTVDAWGNTGPYLPWWQPGILDATLTLRSGQTFYARHGDYIGKFACFAAAALLLAVPFLRARNRKQEAGNA